MKKSALLLALVLMATICFSQWRDPIQWAFTAKKLDASTYEVRLTAVLQGGWHVYSQDTPDGGPVATSIAFTKNPLLTLQGAPREMGKLEKHFEHFFGVEVLQFSNKVQFVQKVKMKGGVQTLLNGTVHYMVCNNQECLPPTKQPFSIALK